MATDYYYIVSALPSLRLGRAPAMSSAEFLELCEQCLPATSLVVLRDIGLVPRQASSCPVEARWNAFETCLRNAAARIRAHHLKRDAAPCLRLESDAFGHLEAQVQEAFGRDPLNMEEQLDSLRWQFLDDLLVGHCFDFGVLVVFRIKLLLLEKRAGLDAEAGKGKLREFLAAALSAKELPEFIHAEE